MEKLPWEDTKNYNTFDGLFRSIKESIFNPNGFFWRASLNQGFIRPFFYALITLFLSFTLYFIIDLALVKDSLYDNLVKIGAPNTAEMKRNFYITLWLLIPLIGVFNLFILAFLSYLVLNFIDKRSIPFERVFRILFYAHSMPFLIIIPIVGFFLYLTWFMLLVLIGLRTVLELSFTKACLVAFIPQVIIVVFFTALLSSIG